MKKFIARLLLFVLPLFAVGVVPLTILKLSGEALTSVDDVVAGPGKYLVGYAYNETNYQYFKWSAVNTMDKKHIWALGSSRVLQFRSFMFDSSFYNLGYTIYNINDFVPFLQSVPKEKYPRYLILGLDHWMFNATWVDRDKRRSKNYWKSSYVYFPRGQTIQNVYKDLWGGKYGIDTFDKPSGVRKVGLNAFVNNKGLTNDGSMYYGNQIALLTKGDRNADDFEFKSTFRRISRKSHRFEPGTALYPNAITALHDLLLFCKANNIRVIGFFPPYANAVYDKMIASKRYGYLQMLQENVAPVFKQHGYEFYDFSTMRSVGAADDEALDGFHGSEVVYQRLLIKVLESGSVLNNVSRVDKLKDALDHRQNDYLIQSF